MALLLLALRTFFVLMVVVEPWVTNGLSSPGTTFQRGGWSHHPLPGVGARDSSFDAQELEPLWKQSPRRRSPASVRDNEPPQDASKSLSSSSTPTTSSSSTTTTRNEARALWIESSLKYYDTITRGGLKAQRTAADSKYLKLAMENYFAREKIKMGKPHHAETIYRRLMEEMVPASSHGVQEEERAECDFSSLAVPTLLLALLLQREERFEDARTVFEGFVCIYNASGEEHHETCCCSARVFQAFALFEMKQENSQKAVRLMFRAIRIDKNLRPVLRWRKFQTALDTLYNSQRRPRSPQTIRAAVTSTENVPTF